MENLSGADFDGIMNAGNPFLNDLGELPSGLEEALISNRSGFENGTIEAYGFGDHNGDLEFNSLLGKSDEANEVLASNPSLAQLTRLLFLEKLETSKNNGLDELEDSQRKSFMEGLLDEAFQEAKTILDNSEVVSLLETSRVGISSALVA